MSIKLQIGELARQRGLTIKALAERAGVAYNTAHTLATGRATRIDLDTLDRMCRALQVEPGVIFVRDGAHDAPMQAHSNEPDRTTERDRAAGVNDRRPSDPA